MIVYKLFESDKNIWYHIKYYKLFELDKNIWYHIKYVQIICIR